MGILTVILMALQAICVENCPSRKSHPESVAHTQGGACGDCRSAIDVCFKLCAECATKRKACAGCGAQARAPEKVWKREVGAVSQAECVLVTTAEDWASLQERNGGRFEAAPAIDFSKSVVVAVLRGRILQSERAAFQGVREFENRLVVTYATRMAQCGNEPRSSDALFVVLPRIPGKTWVVEHVRNSFLATAPRIERTEFPALK